VSHKILVVGSLNMDLVVQAQRHPRVGETILGDSFQTFPGGKGANQAVAAARLGGQVGMVGRVGQDPFAQVLRAELERSGVEARYVEVDEKAPTGVALITVDREGQNTIVVVPGANGQLSQEHIYKAEAAFQDAAVLLVQLEIPLETVFLAVEMAARHGVKVLLNPAPAAQLADDLLARTDILIPNQHELAILSGETGLEPGVARLRARGARSVLVTLGADGIYYADQERSFYQPALAVQAVDTTAAGDAFVGGFGLALAEGSSLSEAIEWGRTAGALAVTRAGAQSSLPFRSEVEALIRKTHESR
jgi:ribokinase